MTDKADGKLDVACCDKSAPRGRAVSASVTFATSATLANPNVTMPRTSVHFLRPDPLNQQRDGVPCDLLAADVAPQGIVAP
jgi:hypothetical protein